MSESKTNPDEPINPVTSIYTNGLTKREYFAAMALQAYCQRSVKEDTAAQWAVEAADALIKELNK